MVNPSPSCPGARGYPLAQEASIRYARACTVRGPYAGIFTGRVIRGHTFAGAHNLRSSLYEVGFVGRPKQLSAATDQLRNSTRGQGRWRQLVLVINASSKVPTDHSSYRPRKRTRPEDSTQLRIRSRHCTRTTPREIPRWPPGVNCVIAENPGRGVE